MIVRPGEMLRISAPAAPVTAPLPEGGTAGTAGADDEAAIAVGVPDGDDGSAVAVGVTDGDDGASDGDAEAPDGDAADGAAEDRDAEDREAAVSEGDADVP